MKNIIIAYPIKETAMQIKNVLESNGFYVSHVCATGASVLSIAQDLNSGVIVCAYILRDMGVNILAENLPPNFDIISLSRGGTNDFMGNVIDLPLPLDKNDFINTVSVLVSSESSFTRRKSDDSDCIHKAKLILMNSRSMSEMQAHKYLQKESMRTGKTMVYVAKNIIDEFS